MKLFRTWKSIAILYILLAITVLPGSAIGAPTFINAANPELPEVARGTPMGGALRVFDLKLDVVGNVSLELEQFTVFEPGAQLIVDNNYSVAPPTDAYFRGHVAELPNSIAVLAIPEQGAIRGIITDVEGVWLLAGNSGHSAPGLTNRKVNLENELKGKPFECGTELLAQNVADLVPTSGEGEAETSSLPANVTHTARVAIETDYEYYAMFNDVNVANTYMADLIAYASTVYEREVNTNLLISWSRLWTGGANSDPWDATSGTGAALDEFQLYWSSNSDVPETRTIAHMLSGKSLGGGIAYVGVLCHSYYGNNTDYDFGVSASLGGNFNKDNSSVVWDILVVTHEIGHNFNSWHTHDYCGTGGNSNPVDVCYDGCDTTTPIGLPGFNSLTGGTPGAGNGTIMSYCHQRSGGYSNISFTFGLGHYDGIEAFRVADVMKSYVADRASLFPACLVLDSGNPILTVNKTGNGNGQVTSNPAGINCGATCSASFPEGDPVTLSATADTDSEFIGWGGDCSVDGQVTMDTDKTCTAEFKSLCGNGVQEGNEECDGDSFATGIDCGGCLGTPTCNADCTVDMSPCYNDVCELGENCGSCPQDCIDGTFGGAVCGNGICEAGNGEDCVSCPADCNGVQTGRPSGRFCCGYGGTDPYGCNDSRCGDCTENPVQEDNYCCGDGSCSGPENSFTCELDCGAPPPPPICGDGSCDPDEDMCSCASDCGTPPDNETGLCSDGIDNDCDGFTDAADTECESLDCTTIDNQATCENEPICRWHRRKGCINR